MNIEDHEYNVDLTWKEGRIGTLSSPELVDTFEVATPPQFSGGVEGIWSPEHLFVSSVSSCFMVTFLAIADHSNLKYEELSVQATGKLGKVEGKSVVLEITLKPELLVEEDKLVDKALRIMEKAKNGCLISRSINTEINMEPDISITT